jgi:hypothetical protein
VLQVEETVEFLAFKRKAKFLLSFMHPALVPAVIASVQCNVVSNSLPGGEMTTEEARAVLGLVCEV